MFVGFIYVERITGKSLANTILKWLETAGLSPSDRRGQEHVRLLTQLRKMHRPDRMHRPLVGYSEAKDVVSIILVEIADKHLKH